MSTPDATWSNADADLDERRAQVEQLLADAIAERDRLKAEQLILSSRIDLAVSGVLTYRNVLAAIDDLSSRRKGKPNAR